MDEEHRGDQNDSGRRMAAAYELNALTVRRFIVRW
jgi:hypothetical protein